MVAAHEKKTALESPKIALTVEFNGNGHDGHSSSQISTPGGPLDRLNAILSLLQPLDRYRTPSAMGRAIGRAYLALSRFRAQLGALNRLVLNRLGGSTAIVAL